MPFVDQDCWMQSIGLTSFFFPGGLLGILLVFCDANSMLLCYWFRYILVLPFALIYDFLPWVFWSYGGYMGNLKVLFFDPLIASDICIMLF